LICVYFQGDIEEQFDDRDMSTKPVTDADKRKQISVRGIASLEGVADIKKVTRQVLSIKYK